MLRAATAAGGVGSRCRRRGTRDGGDPGRLWRLGFWHGRGWSGRLGGGDAAAQRTAGDRPAGGAEEAKPGHGRQQERPDGATQEGEGVRGTGVAQEVEVRPRVDLSPRPLDPGVCGPPPSWRTLRAELSGTRGPGCVTLSRDRPSLCPVSYQVVASRALAACMP